MPMTDRTTAGNNLVNWLLQALLCITANATYTPPAGGGSAKTFTVPYKLRLMTINAADTASAGTEATAVNNGGYTVGGIGMGTPAFAVPAAGSTHNVNAVSYTATSAQTANITGVEVWDSSATPQRMLLGSITPISGVATSDTVQFAATTGVVADASAW